MKNGVWMVQWSVDYSDLDACFSTREKAIAYIEHEAGRIGLHNRDFGLVCEERFKRIDGEPAWGVYEFDPSSDETETQSVSYQYYVIDA